MLLFLDLRLELKSCTLRGRGIVSHTLMTSLKGHGSLQNVPPHVQQDDHADYEAVADGPVNGRHCVTRAVLTHDVMYPEFFF